jgi:serine/threonine protein kinase
VKPDTRYTCEVCGARISPALGICPACALQGALDHNLQTSELGSNNRELPSLRFEHFEVLTREDGTPFELGRGAMGVTYKAIDVNLRSAVALKVISPSYIADELAQQRFLREARAAASVRHPNVASVFHLGRNEGAYFYAMEFVDGETLANLVRRSGGLGLDLALKITIQIATGLAAIHEQALVHRDIKPSNIMVVDKRGEFQTAKIIDLGLAKLVTEEASAAISTPGGFVGTPEFASPEQFAGIDVDIRSDLYSLGIVLGRCLPIEFRSTERWLR